ncbi:A/G-specific adenine glycosylase [Nocardioides acrostichi]|uniref:Adenine DNA glycosylase n=1 Tax=Nocardioides acrostichi TaxID=2784339 RepID=A0A930UXB5_9ACTN|nr:A/G-specific adenine glycosylase [Nocardioides acrostichi]MBF4162603.1 A/G-specific adenine glycosylase [Nocardioides acrostichi]
MPAHPPQSLPQNAAKTSLHVPVFAWYATHARDLPWRRPEASAWSVLVSELMLQQTPVKRVLPVHQAWLERWPTPAALAVEPTGEAVRAWGRLGYPRRALRLHAAAVAIAERHDGEVPADLDDLLALPGVGEYTAAAVASFAYGRRHVVLDTNVRRVLGRVLGGVEFPATSLNRAERERAASVVPDEPPHPVGTAATWAVAVMELGALVCTAGAPRCGECPLADQCAWRLAGFPAYDGPPRRGQAWAGTDRQCRGRLMAVLRDADGPVHRSALEAAWSGTATLADQRERCLVSLVADGLAVRTSPETYALP